MTSDTWDNVPVTVNSRSEKPAETGPFPPKADRVEIDSAPATVPPGVVVLARLRGEPVVLVGTVPTGHAVIICPKGWRTLQRWKLTRLRIVKGALYAAGEGRAAGFAAARFLLNASGNHVARHRNGNPFDIRLSNIVAISRGLMKQAKIEAARGPDYGRDITMRDGRRRSCRRPAVPSAGQRTAKALAAPEG